MLTGSRVLLVHAHPDDEVLATGALIVELVAQGKDVYVLTATRGEQGETTPGPWQVYQGTSGLVEVREQEWVKAGQELGVTHAAWLGAAPARAADKPGRRYTDSGMVWLDEAETTAGPGPDSDPAALSLADPAEIAADIAAYGRAMAVDLMISYDVHGGYGHPDHVALHHPTKLAATELGISFVEIVSQSRADVGRPNDPGIMWVDVPEHRPTVVRALQAYRSQLTIDGDYIVHVGGQRELISTVVGLRTVEVRS